jgi:hypothetical protein
MTITLAPQLETRLRRKAARTGKDTDALVEALLSDALADEASEEELREEYHHLVTLELKAMLSDVQAARLSQVTQKLDDLDAHSPAAQSMSLRLDRRAVNLTRCWPSSQCCPSRNRHMIFHRSPSVPPLNDYRAYWYLPSI